MYFKSFFNGPLAQMSYMVGCQKTGEAIIIDPLRDLTPYIETAESENLEIKYVTETHIHADFASGLREAVNRLGAKAYVSGLGGEDWQYKAVDAERLAEGDVIKVGNVKLEVIHTPGHTPESISFLLTDNQSDIPMGLFTGDFIFVGDVGRPDLLETAAGVKDSTEIGAKQMYQSIKKIADLPDYIQIWPGHGAGSACGKSLGAVPVTTLGYERVNSWAFQYDDEESFIQALTSEQPEPPYYFKEMKRINRDGVNPYSADSVMPVAELTASVVLDLRQKEVFAENGSMGINVPYNKKFLSFAGWYLNYEEPLQLIGDFEMVQQAADELKLIGFDKVTGYLPGNKVNGPSYDQIEPADFKEKDKETINILDVRTQKEWDDSHFEGAKHLHFGKLTTEEIPFNQDDKIYVHCQSGVRSAIAMSILENLGYEQAVNIKGGYDAVK
ncbi:MBL fold metallo-hydrolase [Macrococcus brunensis]|uniref:MBL fold metallo-hydrolase n=1 Tax=Macrococcus brunensis TaxID=198483 RepID=A0A4R6BF72_9STAP|nr:MBL fold metallo-hydrolase [Macrococcus brunensis]TDL98383.1 MBL fold metallo-hydrolase [Macrococcus brunensis]